MMHDSDAEKNACWCDRCGGYHHWDAPCPPELDSDDEEEPGNGSGGALSPGKATDCTRAALVAAAAAAACESPSACAISAEWLVDSSAELYMRRPPIAAIVSGGCGCARGACFINWVEFVLMPAYLVPRRAP